jgi:phage-related tail fiber protein
MQRISYWTDLVTPPGNFRYGSLVGGKAPTPIKAEWLNVMQAELANFILAYLPALDGADDSQVLKAARKMVENFATKATSLAGYGILDAYTKTQTDGLLSTKANWGITLAGYGIGDAYTKTEVNQLLTTKIGASTTLAGYGITDAYSKTQVDGLLSPKANSATTLAGYGITDAYSKTQVDGLLSSKANWAISLAGYGITDAYTKTEVNTALALKQDKNTASLGVNGWFLDSATGRLEVWGTVTVEVPTTTGAQVDLAIVFPKAFTNAALNVSFSRTGGNGTEMVENIVGFTAPTKTGMTMSVKRLSGAQTGGELTSVHYRVIGS